MLWYNFLHDSKFHTEEACDAECFMYKIVHTTEP